MRKIITAEFLSHISGVGRRHTAIKNVLCSKLNKLHVYFMLKNYVNTRARYRLSKKLKYAYSACNGTFNTIKAALPLVINFIYLVWKLNWKLIMSQNYMLELFLKKLNILSVDWSYREKSLQNDTCSPECTFSVRRLTAQRHLLFASKEAMRGIFSKAVLTRRALGISRRMNYWCHRNARTILY